MPLSEFAYHFPQFLSLVATFGLIISETSLPSSSWKGIQSEGKKSGLPKLFITLLIQPRLYSKIFFQSSFFPLFRSSLPSLSPFSLRFPNFSLSLLSSSHFPPFLFPCSSFLFPLFPFSFFSFSPFYFSLSLPLSVFSLPFLFLPLPRLSLLFPPSILPFPLPLPSLSFPSPFLASLLLLYPLFPLPRLIPLIDISLVPFFR